MQNIFITKEAMDILKKMMDKLKIKRIRIQTEEVVGDVALIGMSHCEKIDKEVDIVCQIEGLTLVVEKSLLNTFGDIVIREKKCDKKCDKKESCPGAVKIETGFCVIDNFGLICL